VTAMTELVMTTLYDSTRTMLQREREVVTRRMANIERDARDLELDTDGIPSTGYEREQALSQMLVSRLVDIDNALSRLELGTYGICAGCANQIPPRRLEALPFATLCVGCQSAVDKRLKKRV